MANKHERDLPSHHRAIWNKAINTLRLGSHGYTIRLMRTLLKHHPNFLPGRQLLRQAAISMRTRQPNFFQKMERLLGIIKIRMMQSAKKTSLALEEVENLLEKEPYNRHANWLLYEIASTCKMPETAAFALEILLEGQPNDIQAMHKLAENYTQREQLQKAVEIYERIFAIQPNDLVAIRARKNATAQASIQSGGWGQEGAAHQISCGKQENP